MCWIIEPFLDFTSAGFSVLYFPVFSLKYGNIWDPNIIQIRESKEQKQFGIRIFSCFYSNCFTKLWQLLSPVRWLVSSNEKSDFLLEAVNSFELFSTEVNWIQFALGS